NSGSVAGGSGPGIELFFVSKFSGGISNSGTITGEIGIQAWDSGPVSIFDSGSITGTGGTAVDLLRNAGGNTLTLGPGYSITGNVAGSGSDTFQLGGTGSG